MAPGPAKKFETTWTIDISGAPKSDRSDAIIQTLGQMGGWDSDNAFQIDFSIRSSSPTLARRGCRSWSASTTASAARAVDAALGDPTPGLRIEDQLMREALAQPAARHRLQAILDAGAQTRDFELGGSRH